MIKSKSERMLPWLIGLLLLALIYVVVDTVHEKIIVVGDKAPSFQVTTDGGRTISTSNFGGKLLVVNFWATWCAPCLEEMPSLDQFQRQLAASGVVVLGISVDKNEKTYKEFLRRVGVSFHTARDPEANISAEYGTYKYPETYVINTKGEVVEKYIGSWTWTDESIVKRIQSFL